MFKVPKWYPTLFDIYSCFGQFEYAEKREKRRFSVSNTGAVVRCNMILGSDVLGSWTGHEYWLKPDWRIGFWRVFGLKRLKNGNLKGDDRWKEFLNAKY